MALRTYKSLYVFQEKINHLLKLSYPQEFVKEIDLKFNGGVMEEAKVIFKSEPLEGIIGAIHNYTIYIDIPESKLEAQPYFMNHFNFQFPEINTWVKSEGGRIRIYPWDRNDYLDNDQDLKRRAYYFNTVLQVSLAWVSNNFKVDK